MNIEIYIDGAALPNPGEIGFAAVLIAKEGDTVKHQKIVSGYERRGTNNVAEIMAAGVGLMALTKPSKVTVYSDSQYVVATMNGDYKRSSNHDTWRKLDLVIERGRHEVTWVWVRGHAGNEYNELAHQAANKAIAQKRGTS